MAAAAVPDSYPGSLVDPRLTPALASGLLVAYTVVYVIPLYAWQATRPSPTLSRDSPLVIRARITSVTISTLISCLITLAILSTSSHKASSAPLHFMGFWPLGITGSAKALLLTTILFAGPLYESLLIDGDWKDWLTFQPLFRIWREWTHWRNIVVGPVTEELLFRSAAVPLLLTSGMSVGKVIFLSPIIFGLAHIHHFYEFRITNPRVNIIPAVIRSLFQLAYTSLFGAYATFLFIRTGSLLAVILVHSFCNSMGLPRLWGRLCPCWVRGDQRLVDLVSLACTVVYYGILVVGLVSWRRSLMLLTENSGALTLLAL